MIYAYIVGPMFTEADINQRKREAVLIREVLEKNHEEHMVINPVELPFDQSKVLTSKEIFLADRKHQEKANVFFFELASEDSGSCVALGTVIERFMQGKHLHIYPVFNDLRLQRNQVGGIESPLGFNSFLVGALTANNIEIYTSFEEALNQFKKDFHLN